MCVISPTDGAMNYHLNGADALLEEQTKALRVCHNADLLMQNNPANEASCTSAAYSLAGKTKSCVMAAEACTGTCFSSRQYSCSTQKVTVEDLQYLASQPLCYEEKAALQAKIAANTSHDEENWTTDESLDDHFHRMVETLIELG